MTCTDAARHVLAAAGKPLHYTEITRRIRDGGLWTTSGKTPEATVNARIWESIHTRASSPFVACGKGMFDLRDAVPIGDADDGAHPDLDPEPARAEATMSITSAAELLLTEHGAPLHCREITERARERGLVVMNTETPVASFYTSIYGDIKRRVARGDTPTFARLGHGMIGLTSWQAPGLVAQVEAHNASVRAALLARLKGMDPVAFEGLVGRLLEAIGFNASLTRASGDRGIDVRGTLVVGETIRTKMAVQVKRWRENVHSPTVQQVRGSVGAHEQGMIITTGGFSPGAREEAARADCPPVALMDGEQLARLLMEHDIGVTRQPLVLHDLEPDDDEAPGDLGLF